MSKNTEDRLDRQYSRVLMTPEWAQDLLNRRRPTKVSPSAVRNYAEAMKGGHWIFNGIPVALSNQGKLVAGVLRLHACIEAATPFETLLVQNVDESVVHTIDQHRRRSYAQALESRGERNAAALVGMMLKLVRYDDGTLVRGGKPVPWTRFDRVLEHNPELRDALKFSLEHPAKMLSQAARSPLSFMAWNVDQPALRRFLDAVYNPDRFDRLEPGAVIRTQIDSGTFRSAELLAMCIKALNETISPPAEKSRAFRWIDAAVDPRKGEPFPKLEGYPGLNKGPEEAQVADQDGRKVSNEDDLDLREMTITPAIAMDMLKHNHKNRRIIRSHVETFARDIVEGRWAQSIEPITFSKTGRLLNGQHRLEAVVLADAPIEALVLRGLEEQAFETYDIQQKKAPMIDDLIGSTTGDRNIIQSATTLYWRRHTKPNLPMTAKPSVGELRQILTEHPDLVEHRLLARRLQTIAKASAILYSAYLITQEDPELGEKFLGQLEHGNDLGTGHPVLDLRNRLIRNRNQAKGEGNDEVIKWIMAAWKRYRAMNKVKATTSAPADA